ncbi:MAG: thiol-disulfide isomerase [Gammaproteobacteria bacterium]|nr:thiol-disulfide isomerase [Gammaproteobacteria bacterium]MXY90384.1 thiol-disulfide isomerase [Gammaproteobacteria bacterium]MXZ32646.1 thiol-disulfide isomerase [Gammaproteobacteria bacterium]MYA67380.1 thiol-disulfide isomerase [Gammaproteobacteria bacterium]MYC59007.1 thiol-disulfide isomerase [Gammaproteobacteria bacterium]
MTQALLVSNVVLWVLVIGLSLLVLALARQVGVLHERVAPAGALLPTNGPKVGELTTAMDITALDGKNVTIGGEKPDPGAMLVLFISPTCPVCKSLVPTAKSLVKSEQGRLALVFASDGAENEQQLQQHRAYVKDLRITDYPYVISMQLGMTYQVSKLPFALLIGNDGILRSKGLVNSREHLESLLESMESGVASIQEFVARNAPHELKDQDEYKSSALEKTS